MDLITFLKLHSKINNTFIEDFFGFYNNDNKYNFCVDLDKISNWMNTRKSDLKETLINSYKKNIDYTISKNKRGTPGPQPELILLTPKCFKLLAMQSKTKKAIQVREYYYELEEIVDRYKEYIIQGLQEKINKLENNQKPKINPSKGVIYIIETADGIGHYKIGKTTNLKKRLNSYNGDKKDDIIPIYIYESDNIDAVEECVKRYAKEYKYRKYKEVYKTDINMLKELINECGEFRDKVSLKLKNKSYQKSGNYFIAIYNK
jgi:hypothetical protein